MYCSILLKVKPNSVSCRHITSRVKTQDYLKTPKYPPILDVSKKAVARREKLAKHRRLEKLNTVEEKLFAINLDKYYGWNSYILKEGTYPYNFLPFVKHITRTNIKETDKSTFHKAQGLNFDECQELLSRVRPHLQEAILFELLGKNKLTGDDKNNPEEQEELARSLINQINSVLLTYFSSHYPHLLECMVDYEPRVEAFWSVGGFHPSPDVYNERKENKDLSEEEREEKVEHWMQYLGQPAVQVRHALPLSVLNTDDLPQPEPVPLFPYDPTLTFNLQQNRRHGTNIPGFWPGDKNEFGLMSYHLTNHLEHRPPDFGVADGVETTQAQAILASFAWLHAQAAYQGFSTFSELTYPLVNQCILTDGRVFSFFLYQLNTTLLHSDNTETNARTNTCLALPPAPLFQEVKGNEFIGWNDEVLSSLLSFYLNRPRAEEGLDLKPYLNKEEKYIADIKDPNRREWLHSQFMHMYSNRPRHKLPYEIYDWERIYKIKFPTRDMEPRRRPFERDTNPLEDRKYYEHSHAYIPRSERTRKKHWTGWRAKFAKTYYPEV